MRPKPGDPNDLMAAMFDALADNRPEAARRLAKDLLNGMNAGGPPPDGLQIEEAERFAHDLLKSLALDAAYPTADESLDFAIAVLFGPVPNPRPTAAALNPALN